ncbi:hypothetical protein HOY82DRAFT_619179 [Tuber indicum]|nr:hypothetical protein HOY82DRAFT_619179 [Tuber indicum]
MRAFEVLLPRTVLPQALPDSAGGLQPLTSPDHLRIKEYNRPLTATFFALGTILCIVLALSLIFCCAARLAGQIHGRRRVRVRQRQRLTSGRRRVMRTLEVLRRGEGLKKQTGIRAGIAVVVAEEEERKEGKRDNVGDSGGCGDGEGSGKDLEKGGGKGGWSEWDAGRDEELPEYDPVGFNEKGEMIDAPCPAYLPRLKSVGNGSDDGRGGMLMKEKILWKWCRSRRG